MTDLARTAGRTTRRAAVVHQVAVGEDEQKSFPNRLRDAASRTVQFGGPEVFELAGHGRRSQVSSSKFQVPSRFKVHGSRFMVTKL